MISYFTETFRNWHGRIISIGLLPGLFYSLNWFSSLASNGLSSSNAFILLSAFLGFRKLWASRYNLSRLEVSEADEIVGHLLILSGVFLFPFFLFSLWSQALVWLMILAGIAISSWGTQFFSLYPLATLLLVFSVYPKPTILAQEIWLALTPHQFLQRIMAQSGAVGLRALGLPAFAENTILAIPPLGAVDVNFACSGFTMALAMAAAGFFMGIFLKQNFANTILLILAGIISAFVFNVPRIMLLAIAAVYWGEEYFNFWHGFWGSQITTGVLFTIYYYVVMGIAKKHVK